MGFKESVCLAQGLQDSFTAGTGFLDECRLNPLFPAPGHVPVWGSILDDVWAFGLPKDFPLLRKCFSDYDKEVARQGVEMSHEKSVNGAVRGAEIQGLEVETDREGETFLGLAAPKKARLMLAGFLLQGVQPESEEPAAYGRQMAARGSFSQGPASGTS